MPSRKVFSPIGKAIRRRIGLLTGVVVAGLVCHSGFHAESEASVRSVLQSPANRVIPEVDVYRRHRSKKVIRSPEPDSPEDADQGSRASKGAKDYSEGKRLWKEGKPEQARLYFLRAAKTQYRPAFTRLFLAKIAMQLNDVPSAERELRSALSLGGAMPSMVAHYHLGQIDLQKGSTLSAINHFTLSESFSHRLPQSEAVRDFRGTTTRTLDRYRVPVWYFDAVFYGFHNSNIGQITFEELPAFKVGGLGTNGTSVQLSAGRSAALTNIVQTRFGYGMGFNKNFNPETLSYQYLSHSAYLNLVVNPLARTSWGTRFSASQTYLDGAATDRGFQLDRLSGHVSGGLFLQSTLGDRFQNEISAGVRPHRNYLSDSYSGRAWSLNETLSYRSESDWFNPEVRITAGRNDLQDDWYSYRLIGWGGTNRFILGPSHVIALSGDYLVTRYSNEPYRRLDYLLFLKLGWSKGLGGAWSIVGDVNYTHNASTLAYLFSYNMLVADLGLQFSL